MTGICDLASDSLVMLAREVPNRASYDYAWSGAPHALYVGMGREVGYVHIVHESNEIRVAIYNDCY